MKFRQIQDLLNTQQNFVQQIQQQMQDFSQQTNFDSVIPDKQAQLKLYEQRLESTREARKLSIQRYDEEIRRYSEAISRLEQEINASPSAPKRQGNNLTL